MKNLKTQRFIFLSILIIILVIVALTASGCTSGLEAQSDNNQAMFASTGDDVPEDTNIYQITGKVVADVTNLSRQVRPASGAVVGTGYYAYGSYSGEVINGKSYQRIEILSMSPSNAKLGSVGDAVIIKTTDTKAVALLPGDVIQLKCRAQYEAVAPVRMNEKFEELRYETWELDFCRLVTPVITSEVGK